MTNQCNGRPARGLMFLCAVLLFLSGCAKTYTAARTDVGAVFKQISENVLTSDKPSAVTAQTIRLLFLDQQFKQDPDAVLVDLNQRAKEDRDPSLVTALTELSYLHAKSQEKQDWEKAAAYYVSAAAHATDFLIRDYQPSIGWGIDPSRSFLTELYNASVARLVDLWEHGKRPWTETLELKTPSMTYGVAVQTSGAELFTPSYFESFQPSYNIKIEGLRNHYHDYGIGAPLVGTRSNLPSARDYQHFQTQPRIFAAVTAALHFEPQDSTSPQHRRAYLRFYDPLRVESVATAFGPVPLETDFSTPLGLLLSELRPPSSAFARALSSDKYLDWIQLFMLDRYDPNKIPVVMVHGLFSEPATFVQMFNDLRGVKEIRQHYQFWFFRYPTGLPFLYTGARLREDLEQIRAEFDPQGTSPGFDNMVVIGHSMGGLLSKMLVQDPGSKLWDAIWKTPPDKLNYPKGTSQKKLFEEMLLYKPLPYIHRAVFIATPHRGSDISTNFIGRLGSWLISLPTFLTQTTTDVFTLNHAQLNFDAGAFLSKAPTSIDQLSPKAVVLQTTSEIPMSSTVPYHLILGIRDAKQGPGSSDGVVRYESGHISGAISEKLVPANHSCLEHPLTILEVKRILLLHLQGLGK
jgi:pimeloyl-ACP methyl ester carboxylesterase